MYQLNVYSIFKVREGICLPLKNSLLSCDNRAMTSVHRARSPSPASTPTSSTPVIGITLPFFSYGGSSLFTTFAALGMVSGIHFRPRPKRNSIYY